MKKNPVMRIAVALLVATLLTTCAISNTFAKYTSSAKGNDTAKVAKWSFTVNEQEIATSEQVEDMTFNLFGDIEKIAPGMSGQIEIDLNNTSEVAAEAKVILSEVNVNNVPIVYSTEENGTYNTLSNFVALKTLDAGKTDTLTIYWKWDTESTDEADTALGILAQSDTVPTVEITTTITATQVTQTN